MATTVWKVVRAMVGHESGVACRSCHSSVDARDYIGMSEGVCHPCRNGYDA
jgi:hypothetical protein